MHVLAVTYVVRLSGVEHLQCDFLLFIVTCHGLSFRKYYLQKDQGIEKNTACVGGGPRYALVYLKKTKYNWFNSIITKWFKRKKWGLERWPNKVYFQQIHIQFSALTLGSS